MADQTLEAEIFDLEKEIDRIGIIQDNTLPHSIAKLRDRVLYTHRIVEENLLYHSVNIIFERLVKYPNFTSENFIMWSDFMGDIGNYLENLRSFKSLYDFAKAFKALPNKLLSDILKLNEVRNILVHIKDQRWKKFNDRKEYKEILKLAKNILIEFENIEGWFDRIDREYQELNKKSTV